MTTTTGSVEREQFDFTAWEHLVEKLPAGMQLWMASDLATRAGLSMTRFRNPRARAALDLADNLNSLRIAIKEDRAAKAAQAAGETPDLNRQI